MLVGNGPFPSYPTYLFHIEAKCEAIDKNMFFF